MPDERRHESSDLEDYQVLDASDTLDGAPGDDPLDRGVATPERWSAAIRYGTTAEEQEDGESLDQLLADIDADGDFAAKTVMIRRHAAIGSLAPSFGPVQPVAIGFLGAA